MLNIDPKVEANLTALADRRGLTVETCLQDLVDSETAAPEIQMNADERIHAFLEWADSFPDDIPPLSDEAISRENLYPDRD